MIVGLRDIVNAYFSGYGYVTPAQSAPESVIRWFNAEDKALEEEDPERLIKPTIEAAGYLFALPMNQAIITAGGVWDFMTGDPDPRCGICFLGSGCSENRQEWKEKGPVENRAFSLSSLEGGGPKYGGFRATFYND
ncbi:MAG: hypothetical protein AB7D07_15630 [Desulfovibrionaceae bacterium]